MRFILTSEDFIMSVLAGAEEHGLIPHVSKPDLSIKIELAANGVIVEIPDGKIVRGAAELVTGSGTAVAKPERKKRGPNKKPRTINGGAPPDDALFSDSAASLEE